MPSTLKANVGTRVIHSVWVVQTAVLRESVKEPLPECAFVFLDRVPPDALDVFDRRDEAREQLVCERARLELWSTALDMRVVREGGSSLAIRSGKRVCAESLRA
jgi:hypothetical protein